MYIYIYIHIYNWYMVALVPLEDASALMHVGSSYLYIYTYISMQKYILNMYTHIITYTFMCISIRIKVDSSSSRFHNHGASSVD